MEWSDTTNRTAFANITILRCQADNPVLSDKNNNGALALLIGSGNALYLYPGDANFEWVSGISALDGKVQTIVATHHGSQLSITSQKSGSRGQVGVTIPRANANVESTVLFSYGLGNSYGHNLKKVYPFYKDKGYKSSDATETFNVPTEDTFEVTHFGGGTGRQVSSMSGDAPRSKLSILPEPPNDWVAQIEALPRLQPADNPNGDFPALCALKGTASTSEFVDDLAAYAIKDKFGDIVMYEIAGTKITIETPPLRVPCRTDYPVAVCITCEDLEIKTTAAVTGMMKLIRFDVRNGDEYTVKANPGEDGRPADPGYAGGRLQLAVSGNWRVMASTTVVYDSQTNTTLPSSTTLKGFSLQYTGGRSSNGQTGGNPVKSGSATKAGGKGGDADEPGTILNSEWLYLAGKFPESWTFTIDTGDPNTALGFGRVGQPGSAGQGMSPLCLPIHLSPSVIPCLESLS